MIIMIHALLELLQINDPGDLFRLFSFIAAPSLSTINTLYREIDGNGSLCYDDEPLLGLL